MKKLLFITMLIFTFSGVYSQSCNRALANAVGIYFTQDSNAYIEEKEELKNHDYMVTVVFPDNFELTTVIGLSNRTLGKDKSCRMLADWKWDDSTRSYVACYEIKTEVCGSQLVVLSYDEISERLVYYITKS